MSDEKQLPPCDAEVFEKGESIGLFPGIKKEDVERLCKGLSAVTGWRIDWSYFAGRPHIRALAPAEQHQGEPVELDALTDLATWKRRAIEAESKLRTYDPQVVELGEQAMQALLAEPKPSELVLTKCRLCDQLQADLTERDQRIDQLEQQPRVPDGFALVPQSMLLSKEVIGVINFHCGDTDQEEGGQFGQYTDGRLWVGYVLDDDGNKVHGLHIATDEYPEEGSTTLIEFPAPGAEQEHKECGACGGCTNGCLLDQDSPKAGSVGAQVAALMESRGES